MAQNVDPFQYETLPTPTSIRLIRIDGTDPDGRLQIQLKTVDLQDGPWYHAVSYTWGNPHSEWEKLQEVRDEYTRQYPPGSQETIVINGKHLSVGRGAYDALTSVRRDVWRQLCNFHNPKKKLRTKVHWMSMLEDSMHTRKMICSHAEVNVQDEEGRTPLIFAAWFGNLENVELLLAAGADFNIVDKDQMTAIDHARKMGHDAIIHLLKQTEKDGKVLHPDTASWPDGPQDWCWIDQICINQGDLSERSMHVSMMDEVYAKASFTVVWLGPEDRYTGTAIGAIDKLADAKPFHETELIPYTTQSEEEYAAAGVPPISREEWTALAALFQRPYFRRLWIVQETILSNIIIGFCGRHEVPWDRFHHVAQYLFFRQQRMGLVTSRAFISTSSAVSSIETEVVFLTQWRERMQDEDAAKKRPNTLENLIFDTWTFHSADPRDKIFGLYGLLNRSNRRNAITTHRWRPDYTKSVAQVFAESTRHIMAEGNELLMLSAVLDRSLRRLADDLPSWVPDYSTPFTNMMCARRNAAGDLPQPPELPYLPSPWNVLRVAGVRVDTVLQTGNSTTGPGQMSMWFDARWFELTLLLPQPYHTGQPRTEALWRTLCADQTGKGTTPAPPSYGAAFRIMLIILACMKATETTRAIEQAPDAGHVDLFSALYHVRNAWNEPPLSELTGDNLRASFAEPDTNLSSPELQTLTHLLHKLEILTRTEEDSYTPRPVEVWSTFRSIDTWQTWDEIKVDPLPADGRDFHEALQSKHGRRRLFVTGQRYLGLGPAAMHDGDQIWVFPGAGAAFVLRPVEGGSGEDEFRLVGEAYIHGGMEGDLVKMLGEGDHLRTVDLV